MFPWRQVEDGPINSIIASNVIGNNGYRTDSRGGGINLNGLYTAGSVVRANRVGVGTAGAALRNDEVGIRIHFHAGWQVVGPGNVVANNPVGVQVNDSDNQFNTITRNSIYDNDILGIDLATGAGVNDPMDCRMRRREPTKALIPQF